VRLVAQPSNVSLAAAEGGYVGGGGGGGGGGQQQQQQAAAALVADNSRAGRVVPLAELGSLPWQQR
jgi:phosphoglucan,water dikinase